MRCMHVFTKNQVRFSKKSFVSACSASRVNLFIAKKHVMKWRRYWIQPCSG